jgi:hypothetical protein
MDTRADSRQPGHDNRDRTTVGNARMLGLPALVSTIPEWKKLTMPLSRYGTGLGRHCLDFLDWHRTRDDDCQTVALMPSLAFSMRMLSYGKCTVSIRKLAISQSQSGDVRRQKSLLIIENRGHWQICIHAHVHVYIYSRVFVPNTYIITRMRYIIIGTMNSINMHFLFLTLSKTIDKYVHIFYNLSVISENY